MVRTNVDVAWAIFPVVLARPGDYLLSRAFLRLVLDCGHQDWTDGGGQRLVNAAIPFLDPICRVTACRAVAKTADKLPPIFEEAMKLPEVPKVVEPEEAPKEKKGKK